ncbi:MAG TPA: fructose-bisphosphatase class II, partial [Longimicrobiales bacterium]|nr:fructose-bisphosphatase class II [Longimicrobiales bacterium]
DERARLDAVISEDEMRRVIHLDELLAADDAFFAATAITDSPFLEGVRYTREMGVTTESLVVRASSGSMRFIRGAHRLDPEHIFGEKPAGEALSAAIR